jgi:hypothetical protein
MLIIETGADDSDFGRMVCHWDENATVLFVRRIMSRVGDLLIEKLGELGEVPDKSEIERQLDEGTPKVYQLFEEFAPDIFWQAQYRLACDVALKLVEESLQEVTLVFPDGDKRALSSLIKEEGLSPIRDQRKWMAGFFDQMHNEMLGIKRGRQARVSVEKIIECLRKLPKKATLTRLASEMNVSTRVIQYTLKVAGMTFRAVKQKAQE